MKIGFDAKRLYMNSSGLGNYSRNLVTNMNKLFPANEYVLFTPHLNQKQKSFCENPFVNVLPNGFLNRTFPSKWRSNSIISQINEQKLDVFHGLSNELPYTIADFKGKKIVTIHDLIFIRFPEYYSAFDRANYRKKVTSACNLADVIIAISHQTKNDLIEFLKVDSAKIRVVYQSCEEVFWNYKTVQDLSVFTQNNLPENFILYVGTVEPRKNLLQLVNALPSVDMPLVVVGRVKSAYGKKVTDAIETLKLNNKVHFVQNVSNNQLASLYAKAKCLVYPSSFEGFGLPVLEAMVCGCPVITGKNSSLVEVGGNAVSYVENLNNVDEIVSEINRLLVSSSLQEEQTKAGFLRSMEFTTEEWIKNTISLYV